MEKYILWLEPYTFIWKNKTKVLVYNSLSSEKRIFKNSSVLGSIVDRLQLNNRSYLTELSAEELNNKEISSFIFDIRETFSGDIVDFSDISSLPVVLRPILNFQKEKNRIEGEEDIFIGDDILKHIKSLTIHLHGKCQLDCKNCNDSYKQILFCTKNDNNLEVSNLLKFLQPLLNLPSVDLDIIITKLSSKEILNINQYFSNKKFHISYCIHYLNLFESLNCNTDVNYENMNISVLINFPIQKIKLESIRNNKCLSRTRTKWIFNVTDIDEYKESLSIIEDLSLKNELIYPVFNGVNNTFFEKYVYLSDEDILSLKVDKREIFSHQVVNTHNYGKLVILPNGMVYANLSDKIIGSIDDDIKELLYNEIKLGESWLRVRSTKPCTDCVYQWLCPSPSNYEFVIGKSNLCHLIV